MMHIWTVANKELRSYFNSAVALIFLGLFLSVTVFTFFWVEKFFARGVADVRPMFEWLPILLILLVSALTMRLWSEEQKTGTIEILLTLPIRPRDLVLGKFFAGLLLIGMALLLTFPIPITISMMGDLDWGPVFGGYLAATLLAGTYLSIGLCISSITDNQILALFGTAICCGLLYFIGSEAVVAGRSVETAELLRALGSGARFESIARGVLDLRDLAYYVGFMVFFLTLNVVLVRSKRWSKGPRSMPMRTAALTTLGLVFVNAIAFNFWLGPVSSARIDLTEDQLYSLSPATQRLLNTLDEPLLLRAYVSATVHPKVDPVIPELFDLLREYEEAAEGRIVLEIVNPDADEELQKEAEDSYDIRSDQFEITTRNKQALVNAYFRVLVEYGDQHVVLGFEELLHILPLGVGEVEVKLGNIEYEITQAIRKSMQGFQSLDAVFASLGEPVTVTLYTNPSPGPELKSNLELIENVAGEFVAKGGGQVAFSKEAPSTPEAQEELARTHGIQPFSVLRSGPEGMRVESFYYHLLVSVGNKSLVVNLPDDLTEESVQESLESALRQTIPGFIKTIGLSAPAAPPVDNPQMMMQMGRRPPPPPQNFSSLREALSQSHSVVDVNLATGIVDGIDVLIVAGPENLADAELKSIDQFLMGGGAVIALAGNHRLDLQTPGLGVSTIENGLADLLKSYGVALSNEVVFDDDEHSGIFATVDARRQRLEPMKASYLVEVPRSGLAEHLVTADLVGLSSLHSSPLDLVPPKGGTSESYHADVLMSSSDQSWLGSSDDLRNNVRTSPDGAARAVQPHVLAVAVSGSFRSHFGTDSKEATSPGDVDSDSKEATSPGDVDSDFKEATSPGEADSEKDGKSEERLLQQSPPDARLAVVGSSSMFADAPLQLMQQLARAGGSKRWQNNIPFILNLVDWAVADTELLQIRARFAGARILEVDEHEQGQWEYINYGLALAFVLGLFAFTLFRRRALVPMELSTFKPHDNTAAKEATK